MLIGYLYNTESEFWRSTQEAEGTPLERVQVVNSGARVQIPPSPLLLWQLMKIPSALAEADYELFLKMWCNLINEVTPFLILRFYDIIVDRIQEGLGVSRSYKSIV